MVPKNNVPGSQHRETLKGFFVLEGIDGAGTTTQLRRIEAMAQEHGLAFRADCEPTSHPIGTLIRSILRRQVSGIPQTLAPLFAADRRQHLDGPDGVRARIAQGEKVLCDRYLFSSLAYQSQDAPWDEVWDLNAAFPFPEVLFWFELPVTEAQSRIDLRGQAREQFEDAPTQRRIREAYHRALDECTAQGLEVIRLDASQSIPELTLTIWDRICR